MLQPRKTKYRKCFRGRLKGKAYRGSKLEFGEYGLKAIEGDYIDSRQIEAARRAIAHYTKRGGKVWIRIFPDKPVTSKPQEVRMGSGKGAVDHYVARVKPGKVVFEIAGVTREIAERSLWLASQKLSVKTKIIAKAEEESGGK